MHEFEDIVQKESVKFGDHIVPSQGNKKSNGFFDFSEARKKPRHEQVKCNRNNGGQVTTSHWEETSFLRGATRSSAVPRNSYFHAFNDPISLLHDHANLRNINSLASRDTEDSFNYVEQCKMGRGNEMFCSRSPFGTNATSLSAKGRNLSLDVSSAAVNGLDTSHTDIKGGDLMDYDLPDIGNLEDIDTLFRNCDSTFGHGKTGNSNELSWFSSSSHAIYGSEDTFESGLQSSCPEFCALDKETGNFPTDASTLDHGNPSNPICRPYTDWLDADVGSKESDTYQKQLLQKQLEKQSSKSGKYEGPVCAYDSFFTIHSQKGQVTDDKTTTSTCTPQNYPQLFSRQNQSTLAAAFSRKISTSNSGKIENGCLTGCIPFDTNMTDNRIENGICSGSYGVDGHVSNFTHKYSEGIPDVTVGLPSSKLEKEVLFRTQTHARTSIEKDNQKDVLRASIMQKHYKYQGEMERAQIEDKESVGNLAVRNGASVVKVNSGMTSDFSDDMQVEATCFQQLQHAMNKLDVKTKICIRDGLFRLAKSAERRHNASDFNNYFQRDREREVHGTGASINCTEFLDAETDTNIIDRSIAHLLFENPTNNYWNPTF